MSFLNKVRAQAQLMLLSKGRGSTDVLIPEIPKNWDFFLGTKDMWVNVDFPIEENSTNAIFKGLKGSMFPPHRHKYSDEMITVLNKDGKVKIITESEIKWLNYGESFVFPYGVSHAVLFEEESKIFIHWHPHFEKGWDAEFVEK